LQQPWLFAAMAGCDQAINPGSFSYFGLKNQRNGAGRLGQAGNARKFSWTFLVPAIRQKTGFQGIENCYLGRLQLTIEPLKSGKTVLSTRC
jgi:hypothetical protein